MEKIEDAYTLFTLNLNGYEILQPIQVKATAYDACIACTGKTDGITKTGTLAQVNHTIAVDPKIIALGTQVYIPGLGKIYTAEDTGGVIKGNRIDIFMSNHEEAINFGVQELTIYILEKETQI